MTNREGCDEGYDAYWDGVEVSNNPYNKETDVALWEFWEAGWRKARKHDYDESEG
jgi:hypothetical protein